MNAQSIKRQLLLIVLLSGIFSMTIHGNSYSADLTVFRLKPAKETVLLISGVSTQQVGDYYFSKLSGRDPNTLNKNGIPAFERFACEYYSKKLSNISDYTKDATSGLMLLTALSLLKNSRKENINAFLTDIVMFVESETAIIGLTKCAKSLSKRPRPYAYNTDLSYERRGSRNASLSFWSGHASLAFTTVVFTGYVFQNRHPGSPLTTPVWIIGICSATATSVLRVRSGNHFPSDVVVGAAVGSFIGWVIPRLHKEKSNSMSLTTNVAGTTGLGMLYLF